MNHTGRTMREKVEPIMEEHSTMALKFLRWVILAALLHPGSSSTSSTDSATSGAIAKPECNGSVEVSFEFASNGAGVRNTTEPLYVVAAERGGCITITEIWNTFGFFSPLFPVDPDSGAFNSEITGTWLLWEDLYVQDGVTLQVWGPASGGNVNELRLKSTPLTDGTDATFTKLQAYGGSLDFENTKVVGWDTVNNAYDTNTSDGRSFISATTEVTDGSPCDQGEARMDVVNSEIAYLGYTEALGGLTWEATGFCSNKSASVYGNIYSSELHDMFTAVDTRGHKQGDVSGNVLYNNSRGIYAEESDFLMIHDNSFQFYYSGIVNNGISVTESSDASIQDNVIDGGEELSTAIFLHMSDYAVVKGNFVSNILGFGVYTQSSSNAEVFNNVFNVTRVGGIALMGDSNDNVVHNNTLARSARAFVSRYSSSGRPDDNGFESNTVEGSRSFEIEGVHGVRFINNEFTDPLGGSKVSNSTRVVLTGNVGLTGSITLDVVGLFDMH